MEDRRDLPHLGTGRWRMAASRGGFRGQVTTALKKMARRSWTRAETREIRHLQPMAPGL